MRGVKRYLLSAAMLATVNLLLRAVAVSFNAYIAAKIGEESMGLFTLTMSVYGLAVTLATSGVNLAAVRLTAERIAPLSEHGAASADYRRAVRGVIGRCTVYSLLFSVATGTALYLLSPLIGKYLLCDMRTVLSLRALAVSLPAISLTSAVSGYFTGVRKVYKNAVSVIIEQGVKIALTSAALCITVPFFVDSVEYACLAVVGGAAAAEGFSLAVNLILYVFDSKRPPGTRCTGDHRSLQTTTLRHVSHIALPVALGAYARQGLSTAEHLAIPWGMRLSGLGQSRAMAAYGVLQGMVFPLILFPSAVISSAAGLLVPELTEYMTLGKNELIKRTARRVFSATVIFSVGCCAVMLAFADQLGMWVYSSPDAVKYLKLTAPLIPIMFFDIAVDCMLKGLGEQVYSMGVNIADSALSLVLVLVLVPFFGIGGYIVSVYVCEVMNCTLSLIRLYGVTGVGINVRGCLIPSVFAAFCAAGLTSWLPTYLGAVGDEKLRLVLCAAIYLTVASALSSDKPKMKNIPISVENSFVG